MEKQTLRSLADATASVVALHKTAVMEEALRSERGDLIGLAQSYVDGPLAWAPVELMMGLERSEPGAAERIHERVGALQQESFKHERRALLALWFKPWRW